LYSSKLHEHAHDSIRFESPTVPRLVLHVAISFPGLALTRDNLCCDTRQDGAHDSPVLGLRQASERRASVWSNRTCRRCLKARKESKNRQLKDDAKASVLGGIYSQIDGGAPQQDCIRCFGDGLKLLHVRISRYSLS
jgi:hypothetical protein